MSHRFSPRRGLAAALLGIGLATPFATQAAGPPELRAVALQKHDAGTFYVDGSLQGFGDLRMLVDTGSSYLVITQSMLEEIMKSGGASYSRQLEGIMADGTSRVIPVYRLAGLRIGDSCWINDVEAAILPGQTRPILGMNILARLAPFTFSAEPPQLGVAQCQAQQVPAKAELTAVETKPVKAEGEAVGVSQ